MDPDDLQDELRRRGLVVLSVTVDHRRRRFLLVALHGAAGQWVDGYARQLILEVPGVIAAVDSVHSPTLILVRVVDDNCDQ